MALTDLKNNIIPVSYANGLVGLDLGFGRIKISSNETNIQFPSIVGNQVSNFAKPAPVASFDELLNTLTLIYNGQTFYIGNNAINNTRNGKISLRQNKHDDNDEQTKVKIMTALALLTSESQYEANFALISGLPVLEYNSQKDQLYKILYNNGQPFEFIMQYGNKQVPKKITCSKVKIISQSEGAYYNYLLSSDGNIINERIKNVSGVVCVCDIGFRTIDIVFMDNGRYLDISDQINNGVVNIHQEVLRLIMQEFNIKKELKDIDNIIRSKQMFFGTKTYDLTDIINKACKPFAENLIESLYTVHNGELGDLQMILLAGGGSELIFDIVKEELKNIVRVDKIYNAEFSNSQGYYKYGMLLRNQGLF